ENVPEENAPEEDILHDENILGRVHAALLERMFRVYEYEQVTRLAAEVSGKLPPGLVLPEAIRQLEAFADSA
ncbi:unnamed protein product, partial [Discosporangium mesarthrocarpum]